MKLLLLPIISCISTLFMSPVAPAAKWLVTEESRLQIKGSSNINNFQCMALSYTGKDTLYEVPASALEPASLYGIIKLKTEGIDCRNNLITDGFMETVKAEEYPEIRISLLSLQKDRMYAEAQTINGMVEINIAGVSRKYPLKGNLQVLDDDKLYLQGQQKLKLSDFGLQPQTRMLGMIKVEDQVAVNFQLIIKAIQTQN